MRCSICDKITLSVQSAVEADWTPGYWRGEQWCDPCCRQCSEKHIRFSDDLGEYEFVEVPSERTYTDAPVDYDGFGTHTIEVIGRTARGPVRLVETPEQHVLWQRQRYASGMYLAATVEEYDRIKHILLEK